MQHSADSIRIRRSGNTCCRSTELHLAGCLGLPTLLLDINARIALLSPAARELIEAHSALIKSTRMFGLLSSRRSAEFRVALRGAVSGQGAQFIRADDGCVGAPLAVHISPWKCQSHCLVSLHAFQPCEANLAPLRVMFDLTDRQLEMLRLFSAGYSLAEIAAELDLKPQSVRETFSALYARFELRNQLELLSALKGLPAAFPGELPRPSE